MIVFIPGWSWMLRIEELIGTRSWSITRTDRTHSKSGTPLKIQFINNKKTWRQPSNSHICTEWTPLWLLASLLSLPWPLVPSSLLESLSSPVTFECKPNPGLIHQLILSFLTTNLMHMTKKMEFPCCNSTHQNPSTFPTDLDAFISKDTTLLIQIHKDRHQSTLTKR